MTLVVDAGPLVAVASRTDQAHESCVALLGRVPSPLVVPALVVSEASYLIERHVGAHAERALANAFRMGELVVEPVEPSDWNRISELVDTYADLPLGIVDASIVALAERLNVTTLATLDRKHFTVVRPKHCDAFELVP